MISKAMPFPTQEERDASRIESLERQLAQAIDMRDGYHKAGNELLAERDARIVDLEAQLAKRHEHNRLNIEHCDGGMLICLGEHEKSQGCQWVEYVRKDSVASQSAKTGVKDA